MTDNIVGPVAGECPKCGNPNIEVPENYNRETIIKCGKCGHQAPHAEFFKTDQG